MQHSEFLNELGAALAKAQATVKGAKKDSANPFFKSAYADLASVWDACREALTANGLSVVQFPGEFANGVATLETVLLHSSGQWMSVTAGAPVGKQDAQGVGSVITYLRRYALAAVASVSPEDDDGNASVGRDKGRGGKSTAGAGPRTAAAPAPASAPPPQPLTEKPLTLVEKEAAPWDVGQKLWPGPGSKKGTPLKDLTSEELVAGLAWIKKTGRFGEYEQPIGEVLESRAGE